MKHRTFSPISVFLFFLVFSVCCGVNPTQATTFSYSNFSSTTNLNLVGNAAQVGDVLRISESEPDHAGAAWYATSQDVAGGFETVFEFRITELGQSNIGEIGGDGFAFVIQNTSSQALTEKGDTGFYMGYEIANSLAVEFDTFYNSFWQTAGTVEPNGNHVGIQSNGSGVNYPSYVTLDGFIGVASVSPLNMSDGNTHTAKITYASGTLNIFVDDLDAAALTASVDLSTLLNLDGGAAYVGFTAGGDTAYENHDLLSWSFNNTVASVPDASVMLLLVPSLMGLAVFSRKSKKS